MNIHDLRGNSCEVHLVGETFENSENAASQELSLRTQPTTSSKRTSLRKSIASSEREMIRGASLPEILSGVGRHWVSPAPAIGADDSWELSIVVSRLDYFFSHAWKADGRKKTLALLSHQNVLAAYFASLFAAAVAGLLVNTGVLPPTGYTNSTLENGSAFVTHSFTVLPFLFGTFVFPITFLFRHNIYATANKFGCGRPQYGFLDKLCIHQTDPDLKHAGICLLPAFLAKTETVVVLWSPEYFSRLWCVFEVAAAARLAGRIVFCPLAAVTFRTLIFLVMYMVCALDVAMYSLVVVLASGDNLGNDVWNKLLLPLLFVLSLPILGCAVKVLQEYIVQHAGIQDQFRRFSVRACECFHEEDRSRVYKTILDIFAPEASSQEEALQKFDDYVRQDLWALMQDTIDMPDDISYAVAMVLTAPSIWMNTLGYAGNFGKHLSMKDIFWMGLFPDLVGQPLGVALMIKFVVKCEQLPNVCSEAHSFVRMAGRCLFFTIEVLFGGLIYYLVYVTTEVMYSGMDSGTRAIVALCYVFIAILVFKAREVRRLLSSGSREYSRISEREKHGGKV